MSPDELKSNVDNLYEAVAKDATNKASHDAADLAIIRKCFDIGAALGVAILSIAESQQHIARGTERPWKPGDDVAK